jgi:hypothetical protein
MPCASQHSITSIASCDSRFQPAHRHTRKPRFNGAVVRIGLRCGRERIRFTTVVVRGTILEASMSMCHAVRPTLTIRQQCRAESAFGRSLNEIVDDSRRPGRWALRHSAVLTVSVHPEAHVGDCPCPSVQQQIPFSFKLLTEACYGKMQQFLSHKTVTQNSVGAV